MSDRDKALAFLFWLEGEEPFFIPGNLHPDAYQLRPSVVPKLTALLAEVRSDERERCAEWLRNIDADDVPTTFEGAAGAMLEQLSSQSEREE